MTLQSTYSAMFPAVILMARFGEAIMELRELAGYEKQGEVAVASTKLSEEYPELFQAFSQQWLSRIEADSAGDAIKKARPMMIAALAYLLKLDSAKFYDRVGIAIAPVPLRERGATSAFPNGSPIRPVVTPMEVTVEIPRELQDLIDQYGEQPGFEALKNHKSVQILAVRRAYMGEEDGLQTVEDWRDYFLDMRRWLPK
ncbi:hypothetical protein Q0M94_02360 [Deinococcus radiomollis]|uniref:hypothetical protein n=1 Tax=Deinococcus radiomollis TaxID=468916 RepID=UPI003892C2D2